MTLATHIVAGAAAARIFASHPAEAFVIGLASHYVLDSIAHWDYPLYAYSSDLHAPSTTKVHLNRAIFLDIGKVILDVVIGFAIVFFVHKSFIQGNLIFMLLAASGAVLPDFIQFVYGLFKVQPLGFMQRFHHFMHAEKNLNGRPLIGITTQICLVILISMFF